MVTSVIPLFAARIKLIAKIDFITIIAKSARSRKYENFYFIGKAVLTDVNEGKKGENNQRKQEH